MTIYTEVCEVALVVQWVKRWPTDLFNGPGIDSCLFFFLLKVGMFSTVNWVLFRLSLTPSHRFDINGIGRFK